MVFTVYGEAEWHNKHAVYPRDPKLKLTFLQAFGKEFVSHPKPVFPKLSIRISKHAAHTINWCFMKCYAAVNP